MQNVLKCKNMKSYVLDHSESIDMQIKKIIKNARTLRRIFFFIDAFLENFPKLRGWYISFVLSSFVLNII